MATTIVTKYGSDAPATTDIVRGELAVDTENGRLYTENAAGAVVEIGLKPEANVDVTGTITATGTSVFASLDISGDIDVDGTTNLDVVDIDGAVDMASTLAVAGVLTAASLDISGDIDVDGTTNLDVVDIDGAVDMASTLAVTGVVTANAGVVVDNITIDGQEIDVSSGDLTLDVAGDIILDSDNGVWRFKDAGATVGILARDSNSYFDLFCAISDMDMRFKGNDDGSTITALTLDMSAAGAATFNAGATFGGGITTNSGITFQSASTTKSAISVAAATNQGINGTVAGDQYNWTTGGKMLWSTNNGTNAHLVLDSSGNLLVGTTVSTLFNSTSGGGANILSDGLTIIARETATTADTVFIVNDTGAGGSLQEFRKDGNTIGSLGVSAFNGLQLGSASGTGFRLDTNDIMPMKSGSALDDAVNLGYSTVRFKNLYLSGTASSGKLKLGTSSEQFAGSEVATVLAGDTLALGLVNNSSTYGTVYIKNQHNEGTTNDRTLVQFVANSGNRGSITTNGSNVAYNTSSDQRLKDNITDAEDAGELIDAIQVRQFYWKADGSHQDYGMIAQELIEVAPEAVSAPEDPDEMMGVDYSKLVPMLVKEIQQLRQRVAQLED